MTAGFSYGVDIESIARVELAMERTGGKFAERILSPCEATGRKDPALITARFAAKEAFFKALGTGLSGGVSWHDFSIEDLDQCRLSPKVSGASCRLLGNRRVLASVSSTTREAVAVVYLLEPGGRE